MDTQWAERREADRRADQREYEERRDHEQWREHFDNCDGRGPCRHAG